MKRWIVIAFVGVLLIGSLSAYFLIYKAAPRQPSVAHLGFGEDESEAEPSGEGLVATSGGCIGLHCPQQPVPQPPPPQPPSFSGSGEEHQAACAEFSALCGEPDGSMVDQPFSDSGVYGGSVPLPTPRPGPAAEVIGPDPIVEKTVESVAQMMALGEAVKMLPEGDILMDPPSRMTVGESRIVTAVIGVEVPKHELKYSVSNENPDSQLVEGKLKVGYKMSADLVGHGFAIERVTDEVQEVAAGVPAQWQWSVEAKAEGQNLLKAALYAHMPKLKGTVPVMVRTFSRVVSVEVRPQTWGEWANSLREGIQAATGLWQAVVGFAALVFGGLYGTSLVRAIRSYWSWITTQKATGLEGERRSE